MRVGSIKLVKSSGKCGIEVKSDLCNQWDQVVDTAGQLAKIKRNFGETISRRDRHPSPRIPFIAVGYKGWAKTTTVEEKVINTEGVDAILDIDLGYLYTNIPFISRKDSKDNNRNLEYWAKEQEDALWGLACVINEHINDLAGMEALASHYTFGFDPANKDISKSVPGSSSSSSPSLATRASSSH